MTMSTMKSEPALGDIDSLQGDLGEITRNAGYADGLEYAGFWVRFGAVLIDTVLLMIITVPLIVWIYGWGYYRDGKLIAGPADFLINWIAPAVGTVLFWRLWQATPGKAMLSLRVVDADSGKPLFGRTGHSTLSLLHHFHAAAVPWLHLGGVRSKEAGLARQDRTNGGGVSQGSWTGTRAVQ